ncbi:hypothetical protein OHS18_05830 [Amycolatopsis sp. NBC_00355]
MEVVAGDLAVPTVDEDAAVILGRAARGFEEFVPGHIEAFS